MLGDIFSTACSSTLRRSWLRKQEPDVAQSAGVRISVAHVVEVVCEGQIPDKFHADAHLVIQNKRRTKSHWKANRSQAVIRPFRVFLTQ